MLKFKDFDKSDWAAYCGCETETPLIAVDGEYEYVLDGRHLDVISYNESVGMFVGEFPTPAAAALVAQAIHAGHKPEVLLGESVGSLSG
jgi:hypothetical protein